MNGGNNERKLYEKQTGTSIAFVNVSSYDVVYACQFSLQYH